jgi:hypothetical protein
MRHCSVRQREGGKTKRTNTQKFCPSLKELSWKMLAPWTFNAAMCHMINSDYTPVQKKFILNPATLLLFTN